MPRTDDFSFLLLFGQPSTLTGIQQQTNPFTFTTILTSSWRYDFLEKTKTKEAAADTIIMATPASLQTWHSHTET
jgi:hypothetical protein